MYTVVSHDPQTKTPVVRFTHRSSYALCDYCHRPGNHRKLYTYGYQTDTTTVWDDHRFCSKQCRDRYLEITGSA